MWAAVFHGFVVQVGGRGDRVAIDAVLDVAGPGAGRDDDREEGATYEEHFLLVQTVFIDKPSECFQPVTHRTDLLNSIAEHEEKSIVMKKPIK